jgi:spermidine synthase
MSWKLRLSNLPSRRPHSTFPLPPSPFPLAVCGLGFSAFLTQLVLMRELLSVFAGNELVFGIVLGNWMLLTGIGATLGGLTKPRPVAAITLFVAVEILIGLLPIVDVFLLRWLRNVVFLRGVEVGVTETVAACFVLLAPYCLVTGYVLTLACGIRDELTPLSNAPRSRSGGFSPDSIGRVYLLDNLGNVLGGLAFLVVLARLLNHFDMLYLAAGLNLLLAILVAAAAGKRLLAASAAVILAALAGVMALGNIDDLSRRLEYPGQQVVFHGVSPYGSLVVTQAAGQLNFIHNGVPLCSTQNVEQIEETVHYAMAQRPRARRVLLISGGVSGTAREVLKYPVQAVDYVELDPLILAVARQMLPESLADPRIHVIQGDGRQFVRQTSHRYDVVISDVPDPSTSQLNRFYTREFFAEVRRILAPDGVFSCSLGAYENYLGKGLGRIIGVAYQTLRTTYANVLMLPGRRVFFLASEGQLTADVAPRMAAAGVTARLVAPDYLKGTLTADRVADVRRAISADAPVNEDFSPILYFDHLRYWMSQFEVRFGLFEGVLAALLVIYVIRLRPAPLVVFCGGLAASALEVVLLLAVQVLFGSLYYQVGLIVTMFMLGLVIGAALIGGRWARLPGTTGRQLASLAVAVGLFAALLPLALVGLGRWEGPAALTVGQVAIPLLALLLAVLVGMQFPLAARVDFQDPATTSARLYTADYIGAALGALLVSTLLIPVLGVFVVCLLIAGLNLLAAGVMLGRK